jgi:hypothetical protein
MKKYLAILTLILSVAIIPTVASAAWWNPFTWNIFTSHTKKEAVSVAISSQEPSPVNAIATTASVHIQPKSPQAPAPKILPTSENKTTVSIQPASQPGADDNAPCGSTGLDSQISSVSNGQDKKLLTIHLTATSCDFKLNHFSFVILNPGYTGTVDPNLVTHLRLVDDATGVQIGQTVAIPTPQRSSGNSFYFAPNLVVHMGTIKKISLYADINGSEGKMFMISNQGFSTTGLSSGRMWGINYDDPTHGTISSPIVINSSGAMPAVTQSLP